MYFYTIRFSNSIDDATLMNKYFKDIQNIMGDSLPKVAEIIDSEDILFVYSKESIDIEEVIKCTLSNQRIFDKVLQYDLRKFRVTVLTAKLDKGTLNIYKKVFNPRVFRDQITFSNERIIDRIEFSNFDHLLRNFKKDKSDTKEVMKHIFSNYFLV